MKKIRYASLLMIGSLVLLAPLTLRADDDDAPTTGVARVSLINGDVSTQRGDSGDWVAAGLNAPVVGGDRVTTGDRSRAEIELDYANIMRLDRRSEVKVADLTRSRIQLQLAQGTMTYTVLQGSQADVEIDTPNMAVRPTKPGTYRIQINSPEETEVVVREDGEAEIATQQGSTVLHNNDRIVVEGADNPEYQVSDAPGRDDWDKWNRDRDKIIRNARNDSKYVNRYYAGSQDLDRYGRWDDVPGYGWSWSPNYVDADWAPYRSGRWVWEPYWGWTWVSYEPWGWAPYHYGRWVTYGSSWYWWPGYVTSSYYPIWAPAYVSFIGFGYGYNSYSFGFGYGYSSIGWLPLGPGDYCHPWWGRNRSFNSVNITNINNVTNITNVTNARNRGGSTNIQRAFNDARVRNGITTVSANDFASGRVPRGAGSVSEARLRSASLVQGTLPVVPTRQSLSSVDQPARMNAAARANAGRENFFTRNTPPAGPQSFNGRAEEIRRMVETHNAMDPANQTGGTARAAQSDLSRLSGTNGRVNAGNNRGTAAASGATDPGVVASANARENARVTTGTPAEPAQRNARMIEGNSNWHSFGERGPAKNSAMPNGNAPRASASPALAEPSSAQAATARQNSERGGWQRFASANARPASVGQAPAKNSPSSREVKPAAKPQSSQAPSPRETAKPGWKQFDSSGSRGAAAPQRGAPRAVQPQAAPQASRSAGREAQRSFSPRSAPSAPSGSPSSSDSWRKFSPQAQPRTAQPESRISPAQSESSRSGWSRFPSTSESQPAPRSESGASRGAPSRSGDFSYRPAPSRDSRPPLEIRKPIMTERAPRSFTGGSYGQRGGSSVYGGGGRSTGGSFGQRGGSSAYGGGGRSTGGSFGQRGGNMVYGGGGQSSWGGRSQPSGNSGNRGGGRSAPAPQSTSNNKHGRN